MVPEVAGSRPVFHPNKTLDVSRGFIFLIETQVYLRFHEKIKPGGESLRGFCLRFSHFASSERSELNRSNWSISSLLEVVRIKRPNVAAATKALFEQCCLISRPASAAS